MEEAQLKVTPREACDAARDIYRSLRFESTAVASMMLASGVGFYDGMMLFRDAYLREAVRQCAGNHGRAATRIGVHRNTMSRLLALPMFRVVATLRKGVLDTPQRLDPENEARAMHALGCDERAAALSGGRLDGRVQWP